MQQTNKPPHSAPHERALISCMLQDPVVTGKRVLDELEGSVQPFYEPICSAIYEAIARIDLHKIGVLPVVDYLQNIGVLENLGGAMAIREVANEAPSIALLETHLSHVRKMAVQRKMIRELNTAMQGLYDPMIKIDECIGKLKDGIASASISADGGGIIQASDAVNMLSNKIESGNIGLPIGIKKLDNILFPIQEGSFVVIAARPGMGKTTLAECCKLNLAGSGYPVHTFSFEMPPEQLACRNIASMAKVDSSMQAFSNLYKTPHVQECVSKYQNIPISIDDCKRMNLNKMIRRMKYLAVTKGVKYFIVDHIGLVKSNNNASFSREQQVAYISNELKAIAMELRVIVIVIVQLNRCAEGEWPKISHLRESGSIEQDADVIILLHGERNNDKEIERVSKGLPSKMWAIIPKNRGGREGRPILPFYKKYSLFSNEYVTDWEIDSLSEDNKTE